MLKSSFSAILIVTLCMTCVGRAAVLQDDINTFTLLHGDSIVGSITPDDTSITDRTVHNMTISGGAAPVTLGTGVYDLALDFGTNGRQMGTFGSSWPGGATPAVDAPGSEIVLDAWFYMPDIAALPIPTAVGGSGAATEYVFQISTSAASSTKCYLAVNPYTSSGLNRGAARLQFQKNGGTAVNLYIPVYNYILSTGLPYPPGDPNARDLTGRWLHIVATSQYTDPEPAWDPNYNHVRLEVTDPSTSTTYSEQGNSTAVMSGSGTGIYVGMVSGKASSTPYRGYRGLIDELKISTRAHAPMVAYGPTPKNAQVVSPSTAFTASWHKAAPFNPADSVTQNVWLGLTPTPPDVNVTDPNWAIVAPGITGGSADLGSVAFGSTYYWKVDSIDSGTGLTTPSAVWSFSVNDIPPVVDLGLDLSTYLVGGTRTLSMTPTVTDADTSPSLLTYAWTQMNATPGAAIATPGQKDTDITFTATGSFYFLLTVTDENNTVSEAIKVVVHDSACAAAKADPTWVRQSTDFSNDCAVNFVDFASIAANWAKCNSLAPACL
jgi:hypothetical protein